MCLSEDGWLSFCFIDEVTTEKQRLPFFLQCLPWVRPRQQSDGPLDTATDELREGKSAARAETSCYVLETEQFCIATSAGVLRDGPFRFYSDYRSHHSYFDEFCLDKLTVNFCEASLLGP